MDEYITQSTSLVSGPSLSQLNFRNNQRDIEAAARKGDG